MSQRIRQLEDALEISHSASSSNSHPLLREELLAIKRGVGPSPAAAAAGSENEGENNDLGVSEDDGTNGIEEAMGIMSISSRGHGRFIGRSGGSETLFLVSPYLLPVSIFTSQKYISTIAWKQDCSARHRKARD